jgi:hypothetical protein
VFGSKAGAIRNYSNYVESYLLTGINLFYLGFSCKYHRPLLRRCHRFTGMNLKICSTGLDFDKDLQVLISKVTFFLQKM